MGPNPILHAQLLSHIQLSATPWTVAHQAPPSMGFPRQEYWGGLQFPSPGCWEKLEAGREGDDRG